MGVPRAANTGASRGGGLGIGTVGLVVTLAAVLPAPATALASPAQAPAAPKSASSTTPSAPPKSRPTGRARLTDIEAEVMCPICGTLLELSESPQAQRERVFVERLIAARKTKAQIKDALVAQYGPRVLALPRASGFDLSAYLIPAIAFLLAAAALAVGVARWRRNAKPPGSAPPAARPPEGEDAERLDADIARYDL
jgi:cytochrome c-type biogenesis protein CcmH/NrfF